MGFGMQSWISNMKPRPYFGRRVRPGSEHVNDFTDHDLSNLYHLNHNNLDKISQKKPTFNYLKNLRKENRFEQRKQMIIGLLIIAVSLAVIIAVFTFLSQRFDLF